MTYREDHEEDDNLSLSSFSSSDSTEDGHEEEHEPSPAGSDSTLVDTVQAARARLEGKSAAIYEDDDDSNRRSAAPPYTSTASNRKSQHPYGAYNRRSQYPGGPNGPRTTRPMSYFNRRSMAPYGFGMRQTMILPNGQELSSEEPARKSYLPSGEFDRPKTMDLSFTVPGIAGQVVANRQSMKIMAKEVQEWKPGHRFYLAFSALAVLAMMVSLDGTSVAVTLPAMTKDLNGTAIEAFWTGTSFLLASAAFQLPLASMSHIFGRMYTLVFCVTCFSIGIVLAATAKNFTLMIVGRSIQGIGGGGIILLSDIVVTDLVPMRLRGAYFGMLGGIWAIGTVSGPVLGGVFALKASWRWVFWINIPFAIVALIIIPKFLNMKKPRGSVRQKMKRVDWTGAMLFIGSITVFLIPITWGGSQYAWTSAGVLAPLGIGFTGLFLFYLYEWYVAAEPMVRMHLFGNYNLAFSLFAVMIHSLVVYGLLYFLPLYFETAKGYNPILSGVALFPATFVVAPVSIVAGIVMTKTGDFRVTTWLGWALCTTGTGLMMLMNYDSSPAVWVPVCFVAGIGMGLLYNSLTIVNMSAADERSMDFAIGLFLFSRSLGQAIGVAACGTIFQNGMKTKLLAIPSLAPNAVEWSRDASSLSEIIKSMSDPTTKALLLKAYADSLKGAWAMMCGLSALAFVLSIFMRKKSLDRKLSGEQGLAQE